MVGVDPGLCLVSFLGPGDDGVVGVDPGLGPGLFPLLPPGSG